MNLGLEGDSALAFAWNRILSMEQQISSRPLSLLIISAVYGNGIRPENNILLRCIVMF